MRTSEVPLSTMNEFKNKGYKIQAYVVAANYYASRVGCLLRMEVDKFNTGIGREVPLSSHDAAYNNIPDTIKKLIDSGKLDNLKITSRSGAVIGDLSKAQDVVAIYIAKRNQLDKAEYKQVSDDLDHVFTMMRERNATESDISQVTDLKTQLKLNYGFEHSVKNSLLEFVEKEINRSNELVNQVKSIAHNIGDKFEITKKVNGLTTDLTDFCTQIMPSIKANLEQQEISLKPQFGQQIDYKDIHQRIISNQLNKNDMANLIRGIEKRIAAPVQQISLSQCKGIKF
jgi:hypothetical protein